MWGMLRRLRRLWRLLLGLPVTLFIRVLTSLLSARSRGRRLQPVHDHATGYGPEDQRACKQDRSDHSKTAEDSRHHVITTYQRGSCKERSI
jgi:hypothetical protein